MIVLTCRCCGHVESFESAEVAYLAGWDEPEHMSSWPVTCPLCPGVCVMGLADHSAAHARWAREGRPAQWDWQDAPPEVDREAVEALKASLAAKRRMS